jgi:hypothetical protein
MRTRFDRSRIRPELLSKYLLEDNDRCARIGNAFFNVIAIAAAMSANETNLRSRTPGTKNVRMMTVSGHARAPLWKSSGSFLNRPRRRESARANHRLDHCVLKWTFGATGAWGHHASSIAATTSAAAARLRLSGLRSR